MNVSLIGRRGRNGRNVLKIATMVRKWWAERGPGFYEVNGSRFPLPSVSIPRQRKWERRAI
jgi:hypothetical protein